MLTLDHVDVHFGTTHALAAVSLEVNQGEVVSLLGPNGAGKSTALRAISGLAPYSGSIKFLGEEVTSVAVDELARRGLMHVPEGRRILSSLTVQENLMVGSTARMGRAGGFSYDEIYDLFPALAGMRRRAGWALSGGEQQMLAVGRALVGAPRLLLLDEPSLGLAPVVVKELFRVLADIKGRVPMLLVEQNTAMAMRVADRACVLAHGKVVLAGRADELGRRSDLIKSFLGQQDLVHDGTPEPAQPAGAARPGML